MFRSIYSKFIVGYLLFGFIGFVVVSAFAREMTRNYLVQQNTEVLSNEAALMAATYEDEDYFLTDIDQDVVSNISMVAKFLNARIWLVTSQGYVILDTQDSFTGSTIEDFEPSSGSAFSLVGDFYGMFDEEMLSCMAPINYNFSPIGYIIIHYPMSQVTSSTDEILNIVYLTAIVIFLLSFVILFVFTIYVFKPIQAITLGAKEYAAGNLDHKIQMKYSNDEISYLGETLNYMASKLNDTERYQHDFISNVSHDFRSPLTSIRGYLEAILDGTIPPEFHEKYIRRVIAETDRLSKLSDSMITLGSAGNDNMLNLTEFDINEVIRDVCSANENACRDKNLHFELVFERENEYVSADKEKIKQVLYNLIDNAIKFSHNDSSIVISTKLNQRKVVVSVNDSGIGIPIESINKIWDRFYKVDTSRGKDRQGTGLGLSIVREIIKAHNENIDVVSALDMGTEFSFTLPHAE